MATKSSLNVAQHHPRWKSGGSDLTRRDCGENPQVGEDAHGNVLFFGGCTEFV